MDKDVSAYIPMLTDLLRRLHEQGFPQRRNDRMFFMSLYRDHGFTAPLPKEVKEAKNHLMCSFEKGFIPLWVRNHPEIFNLFMKVADKYREIKEESKPTIRPTIKNMMNTTRSLPVVQIPMMPTSRESVELKRLRAELDKTRAELEMLKKENIRYKNALACAENTACSNEELVRAQKDEIATLRQREVELVEENMVLRNEQENSDNALCRAVYERDVLYHALHDDGNLDKEVQAYETVIRAQEAILKHLVTTKDILIACSELNFIKPTHPNFRPHSDQDQDFSVTSPDPNHIIEGDLLQPITQDSILSTCMENSNSII